MPCLVVLATHVMAICCMKELCQLWSFCKFNSHLIPIQGHEM